MRFACPLRPQTRQIAADARCHKVGTPWERPHGVPFVFCLPMALHGSTVTAGAREPVMPVQSTWPTGAHVARLESRYPTLAVRASLHCRRRDAAVALSRQPLLGHRRVGIARAWHATLPGEKAPLLLCLSSACALPGAWTGP